MIDPIDPGWGPAFPIALGILALRRPSGSILIVMRAAVLVVEIATAFLAVVAGLLSLEEAGRGEVAARGVLGAAILAATAVIVVTGREPLDLQTEGHLGAALFTVTMRRVVAAAAVGAVGLLLSWVAGTGWYAVFGTVAVMVLLVVVAPTRLRLKTWQAEVTAAGSEFVVLKALSIPYR